MMTLEEAIQHVREVALSNAACGVAYRKGGQTMLADGCDACATEHEQLAKWLIELKQRREAEISEKPKTNGYIIRKMTDDELAEFLLKSRSRCKPCKKQDEICEGAYHECWQGIDDWLKQEVSEDD